MTCILCWFSIAVNHNMGALKSMKTNVRSSYGTSIYDTVQAILHPETIMFIIVTTGRGII